MKNWGVIVVVLFLLVGCSGAPENSEVRTEEEIDRDIKIILNEAEEQEKVMADSVKGEDDESPDEILTDDELEVKTEEAELKELSKVTFCYCIKKQKVLDDRLMETEDDSEMDNIMAEMDELTEGECKNLMADNSASPEDRKERKAKIQGCLGN